MSQSKRQKLSELTHKWLMQKGYNSQELNQAGENGDTALMKATREGNYAVVQELIATNVNINARNNDGNNALWFACFGNYYDLIKLLLAAQIDIDNQNDNGATVLMYAASAGKAEVLKLLLEHNPNLDLQNLDDFKAINFASTSEVLQILKNATKKITGKTYHDATKHSYLSVSIDPNYVDASTQPSAFKVYPHFYRRLKINFNHPVHSFLWLTSAITFEKFYQHGFDKLRVHPSAGALYPTEIYVQIRGIDGIVDGIYHLEIENNYLTLIYELIDDGLESYILPTNSIKGFIFLISCVYYRSSWKYKNRSLRYCFLDSGHHLGAIAASAYVHNRNVQFIFDFDKLALNQALGFENKEFITACAISGELQPKQVRRFRLKVPFVCGTNYFEPNEFIEQGYKETALQQSSQHKLEFPLFDFDKVRFRQTILSRRSIRRFQKYAIAQEDYFNILQALAKAIPKENVEQIEIYSVINRVENIKPGLYKNQQLIKEGDFSEKAGYLCVNQNLARDSTVTFFFVSNYQNYQTAMQLAGFLGQRLYLLSNYWGIECSGIGAFYDDETQEFLETEQDILYAMVIGK